MKTKDEILKMSKAEIQAEFLACWDCADCRDCRSCTSCWGLYKEQYMILNVQFSQEEYEAKIKELNDVA